MNPTSLTGALLVILVLCLDLWGIRWGIPTATHVRSYHPDEWTVIQAAERVDLFHGQINPGFYNYSSLYIYALWAVMAAGHAFGLVDPHPIAADPTNDARIHLMARAVTVAFSVGLVLLTWRLGQRLFGRTVGALAGVLLAVTPLLVVHSHYATVDVPATFWMVAAAFAASFSLGPSKPAPPSAPVPEPSKATESGPLPEVQPAPALVVGGTPPRKKAAKTSMPVSNTLSAIAAGLAAGTKYNAGLVMVVAWLAWYWRWRDRRMAAASGSGAWPSTGDLYFGWVILAVAAVMAFLVSTPALATDREELAKAFVYEMVHSRTGHGYVFTRTLPALLYHIRYSLRMGMGPPLCLLALGGVVIAISRRTRQDALMAAAILPYYLVIGTAQIKFMRYAIPLLPFLCIWAARALFTLALRNAAGDAGLPGSGAESIRRLARPVTLAVLILSGGFAFLETVAFDRVLAGTDVRDQAETWITAHIPPGASVGMPASPWFDTPPIIPFNVNMAADTLATRQDEWAYRIDVTGWDAGRLQRDRPDYFLYSEWQARYLERIHRLDPDGKSQAARDARDAWQLLNTLGRLYLPAATFQTEPQLLGINFRMGFVPDDWLYPFPVIRVFKRT